MDLQISFHSSLLCIFSNKMNIILFFFCNEIAKQLREADSPMRRICKPYQEKVIIREWLNYIFTL